MDTKGYRYQSFKEHPEFDWEQSKVLKKMLFYSPSKYLLKSMTGNYLMTRIELVWMIESWKLKIFGSLITRKMPWSSWFTSARKINSKSISYPVIFNAKKKILKMMRKKVSLLSYLEYLKFCVSTLWFFVKIDFHSFRRKL